ncbi:Iars [Symbiodinium sp. KB8]|nr:Iars [Symbiodinium sp. KB8]
MPFIWHDAHASNLFLMVVFYVIVGFYLFPLLLRGSVEELAESLCQNVCGYFATFLPLMDDIFFPTVLITVYAVMASTMVVMAGGVQLTAGVYALLSKLSISAAALYFEWG